jgi:hypothetical protein
MLGQALSTGSASKEVFRFEFNFILKGFRRCLSTGIDSEIEGKEQIMGVSFPMAAVSFSIHAIGCS